MSYIPIVVNRLDDEPKRWADAVDVLIHNLLYDGRLARIVETPGTVSLCGRMH